MCFINLRRSDKTKHAGRDASVCARTCSCSCSCRWRALRTGGTSGRTESEPRVSLWRWAEMDLYVTKVNKARSAARKIWKDFFSRICCFKLLCALEVQRPRVKTLDATGWTFPRCSSGRPLTLSSSLFKSRIKGSSLTRVFRDSYGLKKKITFTAQNHLISVGIFNGGADTITKYHIQRHMVYNLSCGV